MEIQEIEVNSFLTKSKSFDHVFNPYRGCMHRCKYCYAHYMKDYTQHKEAWGDYVDVKKIKRYHIPKNAKRIMLSSVTDPYQPIEAKYKVTRNALKHLIGFSGTVSILTKSKLVTRDIDLFKQMEHVEVGMSIATVDEKFRRIMEEGASPIKERMEALKKIHDAGITTYVFVAPMLPKLTNYKEIIRENQYQIKFWSDMGCNTTPVPGSELYMSLQNGLVDSQENALDTVVVGGMHEVQDYITLTNHTLYTNMMVMSESYFNSLPAAYQEIIENAVAETTVEMIPVYQEADQTAYDTLIESGMEINELSAEDMAAMREIAQPVYDMVRSEIGDEAVDALVSVIQ